MGAWLHKTPMSPVGLLVVHKTVELWSVQGNVVEYSISSDSVTGVQEI